MTPTLIEAAAALGRAAVFLALGLGVGLVYFEMLRRAAALIVAGRRPARAAALGAGRLALAGALLGAAALQGGPALIAAALGLGLGRRLVIRAAGARA